MYRHVVREPSDRYHTTMRAKKHLGQHFLTSKAALRTMLDAARIQHNDVVLEVGPGTGVLTRALLDTGARVVAVEADGDMVAHLRHAFAREIATDQLVLVHDDVRTVVLDRYMNESPYKVVANIPYYITGEILRHILTAAHQPTSATLLIQKEVAERIAKSEKETILSLSVKIYGTPRYVATVPARYFHPPPKVDSAILHIGDITKKAFLDVSEECFFTVVRAAFSRKRKTLVNNLSPFGPKEKLARILAAHGLRADIRAEDIHVDEWKKLVRALCSQPHPRASGA